jgi:hypothetical protein
MSTEYSSASQSHFRETEQYREYRLTHSPEIGRYSHCCQGSPIGRCVECGDLVCEDHGVHLDKSKTTAACSSCEEARLDQFLNDHDLDGPRAPIVISQLQIIALAEMAGVR